LKETDYLENLDADRILKRRGCDEEAVMKWTGFS
jgi:hypothetical protein